MQAHFVEVRIVVVEASSVSLQAFARPVCFAAAFFHRNGQRTVVQRYAKFNGTSLLSPKRVFPLRLRCAALRCAALRCDAIVSDSPR